MVSVPCVLDTVWGTQAWLPKKQPTYRNVTQPPPLLGSS